MSDWPFPEDKPSIPRTWRYGGRHPLSQARVRMFNLPFAPDELFFNGEQGAWYDPSDLSTLFQDSAGTAPVTADGDPVGLMLDKSGNDNHASQTASASRPVYRTDGALHWLEGDGVDDFLGTQLSPTDDYYVGLAYSAVPAAGTEIVFGANHTDPRLYIGVDNTGAVIFGNGANIHIDTELTSTPRVVSVVNGASSLTRRIDSNTVDTDSTKVSPTTNKFQVFSTAGFASFSEASFYGAVVVNKAIEDNEISKTDSYLAQKAGVTL